MANTEDIPAQHHSLSSMLFSGGDPRVRHWPLMGSPAVIVSILAGYLYFSLRLGPALMKNRRPFPIRPLVVAYNVVMVLLSVYFFVLTLRLTYLRDATPLLQRYDFFCQGTDTTSSAGPLLYHGWFYMLMKVGELLDTVFFVLLKKNSHISFLHLLHHSLALSTVWMDINNGITGQVAMFPILQHGRAHGDVHLLRPRRPGAVAAAEPVVEEVRHPAADHPVLLPHGARRNSHLLRLRLPAYHGVLHGARDGSVHGTIFGFLLPQLPSTQRAMISASSPPIKDLLSSVCRCVNAPHSLLSSCT
ncbi:hypothetical protein MRX96_038170 [Rhipicephalus microplus]